MVFANEKFSFLYFTNSSLFPTGNWCPTVGVPKGPGHIDLMGLGTGEGEERVGPACAGYKQILLISKKETGI